MRVAVEGREVDEAGGLIGDGGEHAGMSVPERVDAEAGHHVEVAAILEIEQEDALAAVHNNGIAGVHGQKVVGVAREDSVRSSPGMRRVHIASS